MPATITNLAARSEIPHGVSAAWEPRLLIDLLGVGDDPLHGLLLGGEAVDAALVAFVVADDNVPAAALLVGKGQHHGRFFSGVRHGAEYASSGPPGKPPSLPHPNLRHENRTEPAADLEQNPALPHWDYVKVHSWTWGMTPGEAAAGYRLYAAYCAEIAQTVTDSARKVALLDMAQAWARLAEIADKDSPAEDAPAATP